MYEENQIKIIADECRGYRAMKPITPTCLIINSETREPMLVHQRTKQ